MTNPDVEMAYFHWLMGFVGKRETVDRRRLLEVLHDCPFVWTVYNDDNREMDGLELRDRYWDETRNEWPKEGPCTVLEMLIAFSERFAFELDGDADGEDCFWFFMENLKVDWCADDVEWSDWYVRNQISVALNRLYIPGGEGDLFGLSKRGEDVRNVELWYQMHRWLATTDMSSWRS